MSDPITVKANIDNDLKFRDELQIKKKPQQVQESGDSQGSTGGLEYFTE